MTGEVDGTRSAGQVAAPTSRRVLDETAADQDRGNASPLPSSRSRRGSLDGTFAEQDNGSASPAKRSGPGSPVQRLSADVSREDAGDRIVRKAEAALARTRFPVWEWSKALLEAKQFLAAALKEYGSGPTQLLKDKKPMLADLARRIKVVEAQIERQLMDDGERFEKLLEAGDYLTFISLMEHGWWLREELHGKGMPEVQEHVEELVLMLNNVAMHLVNTMTPDGIDTPAKLAYDLLNRALVLTTDSSDAVSDEAKRRLRAVTLNNMGCYYERRNKLLKSLEFLDRALKLELRVKLVEDPSATHLNLCRVLSRLERPEAAFQHVRCAIDILEDRLLTLNEAWEKEKSRPPTTVLPTPSFDGTTPPPPTTAGKSEDEKQKWSLVNRKVPLQECVKDAIGKFAFANYNAACVLESMHKHADALEFHRKAAEGARQAFGADHDVTVRFQDDLAACSKISHKHHSKKRAAQYPSANDIQIDQSRIPYGCGVVAGPTTIVAGVRAGVKFGFETTAKASAVRSAPASRITLGTYGSEELRAMFSDSPIRSLNSSINRTMPSSFRQAVQDTQNDTEQADSQPAEIMSENELSRRGVTSGSTDSDQDLDSIIADVSNQRRNLEPMALKNGDEIEGFWVDKLNKTAYHIFKVGPVGSLDSESAERYRRDRADPERSRTSERRRQTKMLEADPRMGGELPPMDPRRALEPERMDHLEKVASFLYAKVGPLPELMVRFKLRVFDEIKWKTWNQEQRDRTWALAKKLIRQAAETNSNQTSREQEHMQDVTQVEANLEESKSISDSSPWNHTRMLLLKLNITFQDLKETIAGEFGLEVRSVEVMAKDQVDEDYYTIASEQGLRSLLAACPGMQKTCELYCTGAAATVEKQPECKVDQD